jgi:hypothetical protein
VPLAGLPHASKYDRKNSPAEKEMRVSMCEMKGLDGSDPPLSAMTNRNDASASTLLAIHKPLEVARARGLAQLAQGLGLDLPNPFARHRELLANFLQRVLGL